MAAGVILAGLVLWQVAGKRRVRWVVAVLTAYATAAFLLAVWTGTALGPVLTGHGMLRRFPLALQGGFIGAFVLLPLGWIASVIRSGVPRFRKGSLRRNAYQAVALTTCVAIVVTSVVQSDGTSGPRRMNASQRVEMLDRSLRAIEDGEREMPRDTWDPDYVVSMVGRDPQRLFAWVRANTSWIPYHGVLRGPVGVLMDRQGNSLDRSLLLATLLERSGHTVRLAHGELPQKMTRDFLHHLVGDRGAALHLPFQDESARNPNLELVAARYGLDNASIAKTLSAGQQAVALVSTELRSRVADQSRRLLQTVSRPKPETEWFQRFDSALTALCDHWWVQQQDGEKTVDFDLLQDPAKPGLALTEADNTTTVAGLPAELQHQVTIRVIGERMSRGQLTKRTVLEYGMRPAEAIGKAIVLRFWPTAWMSDSGKDETPGKTFRREALAQEVWGAGLVVDSKLVASGALLANGDDDNAGPKGGVFGGLAGAFSSTMGLSPKPDEQRQLSAVWLEYQIRVPGEQPRTIRRTVFDLIGPDARASAVPKLEVNESKKLTRALALLMRTEILPISCRFSPEFLMHLAAQSLIGNRELVEAAIRGDFQPGTPTGDALLQRAAPVVSPLHSLAEARIEWGRDPASLFVDEPQLLTTHTYPALENNRIVPRDATDIVSNKFGVSLAVADGFAARLEQGVLDTNAEALVQVQADTFGNAGEAYRQSKAWTRVGDGSQVNGLKLPVDSRRSIAEDLAAGYDVVAPQAPISTSHEDFSGWWRVDRARGTTLGMGANGWGSELAEHQQTRRPGLAAAEKFNKMMRAFWAGFVSDYSFCVALQTWKTFDEDKVIIEQHLVAVIEDSPRQCGPHALVWGIVSAVLSLFIVTMGPIISKWLTRTIPWSQPALRWASGGGRPLLGNGGNPSPPKPKPCEVPAAPEEPSPAPDNPEAPRFKAPRAPKPPYKGTPMELTVEKAQQYLDQTESKLQWAQSVEKGADAERLAAEMEADRVAEDLRTARQAATDRGQNWLDDPVQQGLTDELAHAQARAAAAERAAIEAAEVSRKVELDVARAEKMVPATARLIQADGQLERSLEEGQDLIRRQAQGASCEPGSDLGKAWEAHNKMSAAIVEEYNAAMNEYVEAWSYAPYSSSPSTVAPTQVDPLSPTQARYPNGSPADMPPPLPQQHFPQSSGGSPNSSSAPRPAPLSGQQSSGAESVPPPPPNPFASSVAGMSSAANATGPK
jgi:hypothetical protein